MSQPDYNELGLPDLNISIRKLIDLFKTLPAPDMDTTLGFYKAEFIGPLIIRTFARPSMALSSMPGWQGKRFVSPTIGKNVLLKNGILNDVIPMHSELVPSAVDGQPCKKLSYNADAPIPWRWVRDDLRVLNERCLLGITTVQLPIAQHFKVPFLLIKQD